MRILLQRVSRATVSVDGETISSIGIGYVLLVGVGRGDETSQVDRLADKILGLRIFRDAGGKTNVPIASTRT
jgi:D-tyrosyl-tRNA(Tyr) deacylase